LELLRSIVNNRALTIRWPISGEGTDCSGKRAVKEDQKIRVLVADDHFIVRIGLISVVNTEPDMRVVGEAAEERRLSKFF
jgi:hypothetical protein